MARPQLIAFAVALISVVGLLHGCDGPKPASPAGPGSNSSETTVPASSASVKLRLLVVGDSALAQKIIRLRGEWSARSGASLDVAEISPGDLTKSKSLAADVVIYPSAELGMLAERRLIRPLPAAWLERPIYHKADLFELPGLRETAWGEETYAVPLGSPVLVCFYRTDVFDQLGRRPPQTWAEYQKLVEFFAGRAKSKSAADLPVQFGTLEPLAAGWAGNVLLARAAAYAKHRDYYSTLFDKDSLEPRIATEPFVRALTELVAAAKLGPKSQSDFTPADVRPEFFAGHAAMALSWPTATDNLAASTARSSSSPPSSELPIGFVELPGSPEVFNPRDRQWTSRKSDDDPHVPLLGIAGRLGSVVRGTSAADAAFELLVWLSGDEWSAQVSAASSATTLFRHGQLAHPQRWVESDMAPAAARQYADVAAEALSRPDWLFAPRMPGHKEYMAALDDAVRRAVAGSVSPAAALEEAAASWRKITERLGFAGQRAAYCHGLGLEQ